MHREAPRLPAGSQGAGASQKGEGPSLVGSAGLSLVLRGRKKPPWRRDSCLMVRDSMCLAVPQAHPLNLSKRRSEQAPPSHLPSHTAREAATPSSLPPTLVPGL